MGIGRTGARMGSMAIMSDDRRRAFRDPDDRFLAGVASGLAAHLGVPPMRVRVSFLLLALLGGLGAAIYAGLWLMLPVRRVDAFDAAVPPGTAAATRRGFRTLAQPERRSEVAVVVSLLVALLGVFALFQSVGLGLNSRIFWPIAVGSCGVVLLWWQSDETQRYAWLTTASGWKVAVRTLAGVVLLIVAISLGIFSSGVSGAIGTALATMTLALVGAALVVGPWLLRLTRALRYERTERVRTQERADVAAHLHDSVLQTLALIQRQSTDPQAVVQLARTQERELRRWLFEPADDERALLGAALRDAAAEIEDMCGVPIEIVMVGDVVVGDRYGPLVAATREAMLNGAKHSGADRVDVYGEVGPEAVEIFVRDRGRGFDPAQVSPDRLGIARSIVDRMSRHGGSADVRSQPGDGAEVRLCMPTETARAQPARQEKAP